MTAMLTYSTTGEIPEFEGNERYIWPTIQAQIDRDADAYQEKCAKNRANGAKGSRPPKNQTDSKKTERFSEKPKKANTNTKTNTNRNTKSDDIEADKPPTRHKYGTYKNVLFTDAEYAKLQAEFPGDYSARIERLSEYIASTGKSYKSHLATIRSWARKDGAKAGTMPNYGGEENWSL